MKYLLYTRNDYVKKFPLDKPSLTIGRDACNHLPVDDEFISRVHLSLSVGDDSILIEDNGSSNGTYVGGERVSRAVIGIGNSFSLGRVEFFLREGSLEEFAVAAELKPVFDNLRADNEKKFRAAKTKTAPDLHTEILKTVLKEGMASPDFQSFLFRLSPVLSGLEHNGSFAVIEKTADSFTVHLLLEHEPDLVNGLKLFVEANPDVFRIEIPLCRSGEIGYFVQSVCFLSGGRSFAFVFLAGKMPHEVRRKMEEFITLLGKELKLLAFLLENQQPGRKTEEDKMAMPVNIVADNAEMKKLIEQAKKFARSDLFILIQGESGTGKELFARLIHTHSSRAAKEFVAINCAAIPENLLESELFGYEKGAFTGADRQRQGKLEISSGGTLVLDEIGNMPEDLQIKLLRALQEQEFYRLGSTKPIKVDLRIISITNLDLKEMVTAGKFRKDLYYRLVHRMMAIPPLRDRREDIPVLINHFTDKYCRSARKRINGYTLKAYSALQAYHWDGNVRELENEINSLVNLTDDGDAVVYEILSDAIRTETAGIDMKPLAPTVKMEGKSEKLFLLDLLEKNGWNKSKTARDLKMTYRGLHEKLKRLEIDPPRS